MHGQRYGYLPSCKASASLNQIMLLGDMHTRANNLLPESSTARNRTRRGWVVLDKSTIDTDIETSGLSSSLATSGCSQPWLTTTDESTNTSSWPAAAAAAFDHDADWPSWCSDRYTFTCAVQYRRDIGQKTTNSWDQLCQMNGHHHKTYIEKPASVYYMHYRLLKATEGKTGIRSCND